MKVVLKNFSSIVIVFSLCLIIFFQSKTVFAEQDEHQQSEVSQDEELMKQEDEYTTTLRAAIKSAMQGPAKVTLVDQGSLNIPENYLFVPQKEAADFMKANGNRTGPEFVGLIIPKNDDLWFITVDFRRSGYIKDDDAKNWKTDELLNSIKDGTNEGNKDRILKGFSALEIIGWAESPVYDSTKHQLIWSIFAKNGRPHNIVNYNTYALGREGYFDLTLVTDESAIAHDKEYAHKMLASLHYNQGKRYEDFSKGTDRVAEYGLAALVTGVVAKKLGLLALIGVIFLKIWKFAIIIPMLFWSKIKNFLEGNSSSKIGKGK